MTFPIFGATPADMGIPVDLINQQLGAMSQAAAQAAAQANAAQDPMIDKLKAVFEQGGAALQQGAANLASAAPSVALDAHAATPSAESPAHAKNDAKKESFFANPAHVKAFAIGAGAALVLMTGVYYLKGRRL